MLDARHAAAPLRRPVAGSIMVALLIIALTVGAWAAVGSFNAKARKPEAPADPPVRQSSAAPGLASLPAEYTQPDAAFSKAAAASTIGLPEVGRTRHYRDVSPTPHERENVKQTTPEPQLEWQSYTVRRGDTLGGIFKRFSVGIGLASRIAADKTGRALKMLLPGRKMHLGFDDKGRLTALRYEAGRLEELVVRLDATDRLTVTEQQIPVDTRERRASQVIGSSLFVAASRAGLSDRLAMQLVSIFGWEIDFALDIRSGDRFSIIYEEMFRDGESIGTGDILAAEFVNQGQAHQAIRHIDDEGRKQYFDLEGRNLRGTFLRTPMRVSRVTSGFSKRRFHPVLKEWRAHRGVDYGAPRGTPVLATGDGRVHAAGRNGGYGNTVILRHGGRYSTLYAHLSRYADGIRRGADVRQGEVIGYVGNTGLATGPHLHYEFRVDGQHRDPLSFNTPKAEPLDDRYLEAFLAKAQDRIEEIAEIRPEQLASR